MKLKNFAILFFIIIFLLGCSYALGCVVGVKAERMNKCHNETLYINNTEIVYVNKTCEPCSCPECVITQKNITSSMQYISAISKYKFCASRLEKCTQYNLTDENDDLKDSLSACEAKINNITAIVSFNC